MKRRTKRKNDDDDDEDFVDPSEKKSITNVKPTEVTKMRMLF
jgi:hypothetical protein